MNGNESEDIITYNELIEYRSRDDEDDHIWMFSRIVAHEGPLKPTDRMYKGSQYNVMIEWENGETTTEPLRLIAADNPVMCAIYARDNNLLDLPGWKRFKGLAKRQKKHELAVNQAKFKPNTPLPSLSMGTKSQETTHTPSDSTKEMEIDYGKMLWRLNLNRSRSTTRSRTLVIKTRQPRQSIIRKFGFTLCSM
jgi:hypothetical protein